jgi:hypothetical protein
MRVHMMSIAYLVQHEILRVPLEASKKRYLTPPRSILDNGKRTYSKHSSNSYEERE